MLDAANEKQNFSNQLWLMCYGWPPEKLVFRSFPFSNTGIEYFGLFYVLIERSTEKQWGFFFNGITTRAVHFEVASSMGTSSCVMGTERFIARRGVPGVICYDDGTNLIATEKTLTNTIVNWNQQALTDSLVQKNIN